MKDLIKMIAEALVDSPDEVTVKEVGGNHTSVFELSVAKGDIGKILGKRGRNVQALRSILYAASGKENKRAVLEIVE